MSILQKKRSLAASVGEDGDGSSEVVAKRPAFVRASDLNKTSSHASLTRNGSEVRGKSADIIEIDQQDDRGWIQKQSKLPVVAPKKINSKTDDTYRPRLLPSSWV